MSKIKRLAGETIFYGLGSMLPRLLNFFLVPFHTDVFGPEEYGVITKLLAYVAVLNTLFMFGMETAYFRFANKPDADEHKIFNLAQTVVLTISITLSIILIAAAQPIATKLAIPGKSNFIIGLVALMFIDAVVAIPFARLRLQKKAWLFTVGKLINIAILVALNLYFLYVAYDPAIGVGFVILATLLANLFYILFFARTLFSWRPAFNKEISMSMVTYAYPVMLTGLAGLTNEMFSRITLEWWLPENFYPGQSAAFSLGVFGGCYKFAMLMSLTVQAFRYAAEPFFFSHATDKSSPALFARINHYFIIVCSIILVGVSINLDIFKYFLRDPEYWQGLSIVPVLLLGYLFVGVYYNLTVWFKLTDKTYYGTIIAVGGTVITFIANYLLIPVLGYMGSSIATLICYFSMTLACYLFGQKYYPIPYRITSATVYIISALLIVYGVNAIEIKSQILATGFHAAVIGIYLLTIYIVERNDLRQVTG